MSAKHGCLLSLVRRRCPVSLGSVRQLNPSSVHYRLLCLAGERMTDQLRSVSRDNVAALLLFLDRLLFTKQAAAFSGIPQDADDDLITDASTCWSKLRNVTAHAWLRRYQELCIGRSIGFDLFRKEVRWLSRFHTSLHPRGGIRDHDHTPVVSCIPVPCSGGRVGRSDHQGPVTTANVRRGNFSSGSSGPVSGSSPSAEEVNQTHLRELLAQIRDEVCRREPLESLERTTTFSIDEIHRIVAATETIFEQLVVALFISTGLRLGGLCRLQIVLEAGAGGGPSALPTHARAVPKTLVTVEKGRKQRTVHINVTCHSED